MSIRKNPVYLLVLIVAALIIVIVYRYDQYVVKKNFILTASAVCDPLVESCFVSDCDPQDESCDVTPYKKVSIRSSDAPACLQEHSCDIFVCPVGTQCEVSYCSLELLEEGEMRLNP